MNRTILQLMALVFLSMSLHAKMIDGIAIIVEGEAITTAEIRAIQTQMSVSKAKAIDLLIQDRLQKVAMKGISVSEEELDKKISEIAVQNSITVPKMQKILQEEGTSWISYRGTVRDRLKKSRFYQDEVVATTPTPTSDELNLYYKNNKKSFTVPTRISVIEYSASSEERMKKFLNTHKKTYVRSKRITKYTKKLESTILMMLLQAPIGGYTSPMNAGDKFITYKVLSKKGKEIMPFKAAKSAVEAKWKQEQQSKALEDYFEKLRTRAEIQILR